MLMDIILWLFGASVLFAGSGLLYLALLAIDYAASSEEKRAELRIFYLEDDDDELGDDKLIQE